MTIIDFLKDFPDEDSCKIKFKEYREHIGVVCPKCEADSKHLSRHKTGVFAEIS